MVQHVPCDVNQDILLLEIVVQSVDGTEDLDGFGRENSDHVKHVTQQHQLQLIQIWLLHVE